MNENNQKPEYLKNTKTTENTMRAVIIVLIICVILSVLGVGLGIYGSIQANSALSQLNGELIEDEEDLDSEDEEDEPYSFGKPTNADEISYISISYNGKNDFIEISNGEEDDQYAYYYAYDENGNEIGDEAEVDIKGIVQHVFDNDLQYLGENEPTDNETWSVEVDSTYGYSYISGESEAPEWFKTLLQKLDVDNKGYQSKTIGSSTNE